MPAFLFIYREISFHELPSSINCTKLASITFMSIGIMLCLVGWLVVVTLLFYKYISYTFLCNYITFISIGITIVMVFII